MRSRSEPDKHCPGRRSGPPVDAAERGLRNGLIDERGGAVGWLLARTSRRLDRNAGSAALITSETGATVRVSSRTTSRTVTTAADGTYTVRLDIRDCLLDITATRRGYQAASTRISRAASAVLPDLTLTKQ
jgi:hypothetical protein